LPFLRIKCSTTEEKTEKIQVTSDRLPKVDAGVQSPREGYNRMEVDGNVEAINLPRDISNKRHRRTTRPELILTSVRSIP
jgi:hypothetical protein